MADKVSTEKRSEIMSKVKSFDTKPEILVRKFLFENGLRYRLHDKTLPGKPDIKLTKYKTIVLVHGCFWHGHKKCNQYVMPKTNKKFWYGKIEKNIKRDAKQIRELRTLGWHVYTIWECELKPKKREVALLKLLNKITKNW